MDPNELNLHAILYTINADSRMSQITNRIAIFHETLALNNTLSIFEQFVCLSATERESNSSEVNNCKLDERKLQFRG